MTGTDPDPDPGSEIAAGSEAVVEPGLPRPVGVDEERLTGAELRRLTARVRRHNARPAPGQVATDVAEAVVLTLLVGVNLWSLALSARTALGPEVVTGGVGLGLIQALALGLALLAGVQLALQLGPAGVSSAGARWWLPTQSDRSGVVTPSVVRGVVVGVVAGLLSGALPAAVVGMSFPGIAADAVFGAALGLGVIAGAGALQVLGLATNPRVGQVLDLLLTVGAAGGLALATWGPPWPAWSAPWGLSALIGFFGFWALAVWVPRLERLRAGSLRQRAAASAEASAALYSLDGSSLGRLLSTGQTTHAFARLLRGASGPGTTMLVADLVHLVRVPGVGARLLAVVAVGVAGIQVPALADGVGLWITLVGAGYAAALVSAVGPRAAGENRRLDGLVPLGVSAVRAVRMVWPVAGAVLVVLVIGLVTGGAQLGAAVPAAVVLGAATVRSAYRGEVRWDVPVIATPAGALPTGLVLHVLRGPDLAVLGTLPLAWVVVFGTAVPTMIALQVVFAVGGVLWATHVKRADGTG